MTEEPEENYTDKAAILFYTGTDQDLLAADGYLKRYPGAKIILISTVPQGEAPFATYSKRQGDGGPVKRIVPTTTKNAPWLRYGDRISYAVLAEKGMNDRTASIHNMAEQVKEVLNENRWNLVGILPTCMHAWNEVGIANFAEAMGGVLEDYTSADAIKLCNDKLAFSEKLRDIPSRHMVVPKDLRCRDGEEREPARTSRARIWEDIQTFIPQVRQTDGSWKIVLKPTWGGGSLGTRIISSEDLKEEGKIDRLIDEHLKERAQMPLVGGPEISMLQECVGDGEVGIHAVKKGDEIIIEMTMKEMHEGKEASHFIPGNDDPLRPLYEEYRDAIRPVIEQLYTELENNPDPGKKIKLRHMNFDVRVWKEDGEVKFSLIDAQARTGLGHPEMLNYVYASEGKEGAEPTDAQGLLLGMSLNTGLDKDNPITLARTYNEQIPNYSATVDTLYPKGGLVSGNPLILAAAVHSKVPGIFYAAAPHLVDGDRVSELLSINSSGHMTLGSYSKTVMDAARISNAFLRGLNVYIQPDDPAHPAAPPQPIRIERKGGKEVPEVSPLTPETSQITPGNIQDMAGIAWEEMEKLAQDFRSTTGYYPTIVVPANAEHKGGIIRLDATQSPRNTTILVANYKSLNAKQDNMITRPPFLFRMMDNKMWGFKKNIPGEPSTSAQSQRRIRKHLRTQFEQGWSSITKGPPHDGIIPFTTVALTSEDINLPAKKAREALLGDSSIASINRRMAWVRANNLMQWCFDYCNYTDQQLLERMQRFAGQIGYVGSLPSTAQLSAYRQGIITHDITGGRKIVADLFLMAIDTEALALKRYPPVDAQTMNTDVLDAIQKNRVVMAVPGTLPADWVSARAEDRIEQFTLPWFFAQRPGLTNQEIAHRIARAAFESPDNIDLPPFLSVEVSMWKRGKPVPEQLVPYLAKILNVDEMAAQYFRPIDVMNTMFRLAALENPTSWQREPVTVKTQPDDASVIPAVQKQPLSTPVELDTHCTLNDFFNVSFSMYSNNMRLITRKYNRFARAAGDNEISQQNLQELRIGKFSLSATEAERLEQAMDLDSYFVGREHLRQRFRELVQTIEIDASLSDDPVIQTTPAQRPAPSKTSKSSLGPAGRNPWLVSGSDKGVRQGRNAPTGRDLPSEKYPEFSLQWFFAQSPIGKEQRNQTTKTVARKIADRMRTLATQNARDRKPSINFRQNLPSLVEGWMTGSPVEPQHYGYMPYLAYGLNVAEMAKSAKLPGGDEVTETIMETILKAAATPEGPYREIEERGIVWEPSEDPFTSHRGRGKG